MKTREGQPLLLHGKPWRCGRHRGHVLGLAVRERDGVTRLHVFERARLYWGAPVRQSRTLGNSATPNSMPAGNEEPELEADVGPAIAVLEAGRVRCSVCGAERRWVPVGQSLGHHPRSER